MKINAHLMSYSIDSGTVGPHLKVDGRGLVWYRMIHQVGTLSTKGCTMRSPMMGGLWALAMLLGIACAALAHPEDIGFTKTPGRALNGVPANRSVNTQGGATGTTRVNPANGSAGWFAQGGGATWDEEIVSTDAHFGNQSLRVGNWNSSGIINMLSTPWLSQPAGETGTKDQAGTGVVACTNRFRASFWFRTVDTTPAAPGNSFVSMAPDDGNGSRVGGNFAIRDDGVLRIQWASYWREYDAHVGGALTGLYATVNSPNLGYGVWYKVAIEEIFVDGNGGATPGTHNDIIRLTIYDAATNLVWSADENTVYTGLHEGDGSAHGPKTGLTTWEDASWVGSSSNAVNSMQWRIRLDTDLNYGVGSYVNPRPGGFLFDDFIVETGPGIQYYTSFEVKRYTGTVISIR